MWEAVVNGEVVYTNSGKLPAAGYLLDLMEQIRKTKSNKVIFNDKEVTAKTFELRGFHGVSWKGQFKGDKR